MEFKKWVGLVSRMPVHRIADEVAAIYQPALKVAASAQQK